MDYDSDARSVHERTRVGDARSDVVGRKILEQGIKRLSSDGAVTREPGASSRKTEPARSAELDGFGVRDSAKTVDRGSRGKARSNIDSEYPVRADGREGRDRIHGPPGSKKKGTAGERMTKIKRDSDSRDRKGDRSRERRVRRQHRDDDSDEEEIGRSRKGAGDSSPRRKVKKNRLNRVATLDDEEIESSPRTRRSRSRKSPDDSNQGRTPRERGRRHRRALSDDEKENERNGMDDGGQATGRRGTRKTQREQRRETDISKSKEARGRRKKKADALDSQRRTVPYSADEEESVLKRDRRRKGRSAKKTEGTVTELKKKHKAGGYFNLKNYDSINFKKI